MLATTASATAAARLQRTLKEHGIFADIVQTPASLSSNGCGYSVRFPDAAYEEVLYLAKAYSLKIRAVWLETGSKQEPYKKIHG